MASASTSFDVDRDPAEDAKIRAACAFHLAIPVRDIEEARAFYGPDGVPRTARGALHSDVDRF